MNASTHFQQGNLADAIAAAAAEVKKNPLDLTARGLYCELLCFQGDWEKIDRQLETLESQEPKFAANISLFRQLLRANKARTEFFEEGRAPEVVAAPDDLTRKYLEAALLIREKSLAAAGELLRTAERERPALAGTCDGVAFDDLRDLDDLMAGTLELLTSTGKYYWVPWTLVRRLEIQPLKTARDVLWRPAEIDVKEGPTGVVYLPALYYGSQQADDPALSLGRGTSWRDNAHEPVRGLGQRQFLIGEETKTLLEFTLLEFNV